MMKRMYSVGREVPVVTDAHTTVDTTPAPPLPPPPPTPPTDDTAASTSTASDPSKPLPAAAAVQQSTYPIEDYTPHPRIPYHTLPSGTPDLYVRGRSIKGKITINYKRIRPPRTIPVTGPNGYPEPTTVPITPEYLEMLNDPANKTTPHPLWKFFTLTFSGSHGYSKDEESFHDMGSLPRLMAKPEDAEAVRANSMSLNR
jgi:hypothetical protein